MTPHELGRYGENIACTYLREHGYVILDRNWSCRYGELDIVAVSPYENGRKNAYNYYRSKNTQMHAVRHSC